MSESVFFVIEISWNKTIAIIVLAILYFVGFYKEWFQLTGDEKNHLNQLEKNTGNKLSGRVITAIIGLLFVAISFLVIYLF